MTSDIEVTVKVGLTPVLLATVSVSGFAVYQCQNQGGNVAPGQNKVLVGPATAPTFIDSDAIKNGNLTLVTMIIISQAGKYCPAGGGTR